MRSGDFAAGFEEAVAEEPMDTCVFCKIVAGKIPAKKVAENEGAIAFRPQPLHAGARAGLIPEEARGVAERVGDGSVMAPVFGASEQDGAPERLDKSGWRAVINTGSDAHQVVFHVHLHVLAGARWGGRRDEASGEGVQTGMCFPSTRVCTSWVPSVSRT